MDVYSWVYIIINNLSVSHFSVMNKQTGCSGQLSSLKLINHAQLMLFHTVYSTLVAKPEISLSNYRISLSNYRTCDTQLIKFKADSLEQGSPNNGPRSHFVN